MGLLTYAVRSRRTSTTLPLPTAITDTVATAEESEPCSKTEVDALKQTLPWTGSSVRCVVRNEHRQTSEGVVFVVIVTVAVAVAVVIVVAAVSPPSLSSSSITLRFVQVR